MMITSLLDPGQLTTDSSNFADLCVWCSLEQLLTREKHFSVFNLIKSFWRLAKYINKATRLANEPRRGNYID